MYCCTSLQSASETTSERRRLSLARLLEDRQNWVGEGAARETKMMNGERGLQQQEEKKAGFI